MSKTNNINAVEIPATILGKKTKFNGIMRFKDSLKIDGYLEGKIISEGYLYIEEGAEINADINVGSVVIGGKVNGNVFAKESLHIKSTAKLMGNIKTAKLKIEDGVLFEGSCEMLKNDDNIDIFSQKTTEIKKTVKSGQ